MSVAKMTGTKLRILRSAAVLIALSLQTMLIALPAAAATKSQGAAAGSPISADTTPVATRKIAIQAKKYAFIPAEITLTVGQPVTLELTSLDVRHSLVVKGLGINGNMVKGNVTKVTITPDKVGDFRGECGNFCGMGHGRMHFVAHVIQP